MATASIVAGQKANIAKAKLFRRSGRRHPLSDEIARVARLIWPTKTATELSIRTGTSDRACRELLSSRGGMSLQAVANLLGSEEGLEFLLALLGGASPAWRRKLEVHIDISLTRFALEEQRERIADLEARAGAEFSSPNTGRRKALLSKRI